MALLLVAAAVTGCHHASPAGPADPLATMDAPLRQHLATVSDSTLVDVLVGVGRTAPDDARRGLEAAGLEVRTVAGGVVVARGVRSALQRAAALAWVEQIEMSQERSFSTERPAPPSPAP